MAPTKGNHGEGGKKGPRKAPQFTHLPPQKAMKLQKQWAEQQKIKYAYRAELRKAGRQNLLLQDHEAPSNKEKIAKDNHDSADVAVPSTSQNPDRKDASFSRSQHRPSTSKESASSNQTPSLQPSQPASSEKARARARKLAKIAYSPESLHNFKSDPLHKKSDSGVVMGKGGRGVKGQPNMRKRMQALLAQIELKT
ncbi:uncharacterized protein EI90DRAFT_3063684 [Cantharellus anzutake]|uniref:uncharacterized protein n=1 Tax=Cantharellus anzutake TaxID=1750568 RepID=UPI0019050961|nr:uncharacterized protein EI90DRAFT_3063684 [Cantharellus anzutake]KAF8328819.1 hypothetical protein EI90DRAFT_3063684 [Cantharellus anzutake]